MGGEESATESIGRASRDRPDPLRCVREVPPLDTCIPGVRFSCLRPHGGNPAGPSRRQETQKEDQAEVRARVSV